MPAGLQVDADPEQLSRILVNLLRNAVQALSQAGAPRGAPRLGSRQAREGRTVTISVSDNGPGLPDASASLFSAFQGSARSGGTGLGLAIAAELAACTAARSRSRTAGPGACFRVTIPDRHATGAKRATQAAS